MTASDQTAELGKTIILAASAVMYVFIALEIRASRKRKLGIYTLKETLTSVAMSVGNTVISALIPISYKLLFLEVGARFAPKPFAPGVLHFLAAFVLTDFAYYWNHRMNHRFGFFWSFHEAHHSSPELNLITAIRTSWLMPLFGALFYMPVTMLGISPHYVLLCLILNLYAQWWCHTPLIDKVPLIEGVLNTPAAHRVHHSSDFETSCSNFGGCFMLWDRLFGTYRYEKERTTSFGINSGFVSHNPLVVNVHGIIGYWRPILARVAWRRVGIGAAAAAALALVAAAAELYRLGGDEAAPAAAAVTAGELGFGDAGYLRLNAAGATFRKARRALEERFVANDAGGGEPFAFDPDRYIEAFGGEDLRSAKLNHVARLKFDADTFSYDFGRPNLEAWGELPHPMQRQLSVPVGRYDQALDPQRAAAPSPYDDAGFQRGLDRTTTTGLTSGNAVTLHQNGASFAAVERVIDEAKGFVLIQMLAFSCGGAKNEALIGKLIDRRADGVDVKVVVDGLFARLSQPCLTRLRDHRVDVVEVPTGDKMLKPALHSSFVLNERSHMLIGSQSFYWSFFEADGVNFLDRDMGLELTGPAATDALPEFLHIYQKFSAEPRGVDRIVGVYNDKLAAETDAGLRGESHYAAWLAGPKSGLCRFAAQRPAGERTNLSTLLTAHMRAAASSMSFSSVKFTDGAAATDELVDLLREKARQNVRVDLFGNGQLGGNGELTMEIKRSFDAAAARAAKGSALARIESAAYHLLLENTYRSEAKTNFASYRRILAPATPNVVVWANSNFTHHKTWDFDNKVFAVTSAQFSADGLAHFYDTGVFCLDAGAQKSYAAARALDVANSVPFTAASFRM